MEIPPVNRRYDIIENIKNLKIHIEKLDEEYEGKHKNAQYKIRFDMIKHQLISLLKRFEDLGTKYNIVRVRGKIKENDSNLSRVTNFEIYFTDTSTEEANELASSRLKGNYLLTSVQSIIPGEVNYLKN